MRVVGIGVASASLVATATILALYPLDPAPLGIVLTVYAAALWRWTGLWLILLPVVIPCLDLSPWSGWLVLSEVEPFVLVTIAILSLRAPPGAADFVPTGWPGYWLLATLGSAALGLILGLMSPDPSSTSALPFLTWENTLRQVKGLAIALILLPFLRQRQRVHRDMPSLLGMGMLLGLTGVGALVMLERALFVSVFDLATDYRAVGPFASMQFGGGHIGAYLTMALPFLILALPAAGRRTTRDTTREIAPGVLLALRQDAADPVYTRSSSVGLMVLCTVAAALGLYALLVTFARTGLAATLLAVITAATLYGIAAMRQRRGAILLASMGAALALGVLAALTTAIVFSPRLASRFDTILPDLEQRRAHWRDGLALMDRTLFAKLVGMGTGTYPRIARARAGASQAPANVALVPEGSTHLLRLYPGSPLYLGQKITIEPGTDHRLRLWLRAPDGPAGVRVLLCEKLLLYSDGCKAVDVAGEPGLTWHPVEISMPSGELGLPRLLGIARPVEFALTLGSSTNVLDINAVSLRDPADMDRVVNGAWIDGLNRWFPTDDDHLVWQIKNQFLMWWFEQGAVGLLVFLGIAGCGVAGAARATMCAQAGAAAVAASLVGFLAAGMLDYLMMSPRLSLLFWMMAMVGLTLGAAPPADTRPDAGKHDETMIW